MDEGTRWKITKDNLVRHDEMLVDLLNSQEEVCHARSKIQGALNLILGRLGVLERAPAVPNVGAGLLSILNPYNRNRAQLNTVALPMWELPCFASQEPKVWIRKCERYFIQYRVDNEQRVELAALYLNDVAEVWYQSMVLSGGIPNWIEFREELISDVVEEFNKLQQSGNVDEFLERSEDLKDQMLIRFIGALKKEIKFEVKMFKPTMLKEAVEKVRMKEMAIEVARNRSKGVNRIVTPIVQEMGNKGSSAIGNINGPYRLNPEVYEFRKSNHLCFRYGEKYGPGHLCKTRQLNCLTGIIVNEDDNEPVLVTEENEEITIERIVEQEVQQVVCLNALTGHNKGENTILVGGTVKKRDLAILIDSGSTHSFIDKHTVTALVYQPCPCLPVRVTVADGNYVMCNSHRKDFSWKMQERIFTKDLLIIPLGGCALVLGNNWMKKHNPTKFDHEQRCVTIGKKTNKLVLPRIVEEGNLSMLSSEAMRKMLKKGQDMVTHLFMMNMVTSNEEEEVDEVLQEVLVKYSYIFTKPKSLPPARAFDHEIRLKPGVMPISLRPYRYNFHQKNELEKQEKEMLSSGIIQASQFPYYSLALFVKKKDGT
uniref:Retrotransposon gag domain-containing protein n=2 Tax=Solanum lycopersicum TaxID=4081 RepID=A0A3Q7FJK1_SOLLC